MLWSIFPVIGSNINEGKLSLPFGPKTALYAPNCPPETKVLPVQLFKFSPAIQSFIEKNGSP